MENHILLKHPATKKTLLATPLLIAVWWLLPNVIRYFSPYSGIIDSGIWQVVLLAIIVWFFLLVTGKRLSVPLYKEVHEKIAQQFNDQTLKLTLWQQHVLQFAYFALAALSGVGCLLAIC